MLSDRARLALSDIRDDIRYPRRHTTRAGFSLRHVARDPCRRPPSFYAVTRCLEIISEAARRLPPGVRNRHPQLPWRAITGAGNVYRHDYDNVVEQIVWRTVTHDLAPLLAIVERELSAAGSPSP
jgi:uncharacterized protein with HEPN domain